MRLKKNNVYIVRIPAQVQEILKELRIVSEGFLFQSRIDEQIVRKIAVNAPICAVPLWLADP